MKTYISHLFRTLAAILVLGLTACSSDSDFNFSTQAGSDCIVTAVRLGGIPRTVHTTTPAGRDTTYTATVTGSYYAMHIDQINRRIYNTDSLPHGTHPEKVIFETFSTTGVASIRSLQSDEDTIFTLTDTTDCSRQRLITIYAYDGISSKTYTLDVNVHQEAGDTFRWQTAHIEEDMLVFPEGKAGIRVRHDGTTLAYGERNGRPVVVNVPEEGTCTETALPEGFDVRSVVSNPRCDRFYALVKGWLYASDNGTDWTVSGKDQTLDGLILAGTRTIVALKEGRFISTSDEGLTWNAEEADEPEHLPQTEAYGTVIASLTDPDMEEFLIVGRNSEKSPVVWRRNEDLKGLMTFNWYYLPEIDNKEVAVPTLTESSILTYDNATLLTGTTAEGKPADIYSSRDNGRTWHKDVIKALPLTDVEGNRIFAAAGPDNFIRVLETATGKLWKGRHNRLGWNDEQTKFE